MKPSMFLMAATLFIAGCGAPAPRPPPPPAEVFVGHPLQIPIVEWDELMGRLEAVDSVEVRSRVSGYLQSVHFDEGQMVKEGDLLFIVDPRPFEADVALARALVSEAGAKVKQARAQLAAAEAGKRSAQARKGLAGKQVGRTQRLVATGGLPVADQDTREAEVAQAEAAVDEAGAQIDSSRAALAAAEAGVLSAESRLAIAELNLKYTRVEAPLTGRISRRQVSEGNLIVGGGAGATLLTVIVAIDPIYCVCDVDEKTFLKYERLAREGTRQSSRGAKNPILLALADETGMPHRGHMDFIENRLDQGTGTLRGRAILRNPHGTLTPGLFARVRLPGSGRYPAILVPDTCVGTDQSEKFVLVLGADDTVRRQVVQLGAVSHGLRIVKAGLKPTDSVVLRGLQRVRLGAKVIAKREVIKPGADGLPDDYVPLPPEQWIKRPVPRVPR